MEDAKRNRNPFSGMMSGLTPAQWGLVGLGAVTVVGGAMVLRNRRRRANAVLVELVSNPDGGHVWSSRDERASLVQRVDGQDTNGRVVGVTARLPVLVEVGSAGPNLELQHLDPGLEHGSSTPGLLEISARGRKSNPSGMGDWAVFRGADGNNYAVIVFDENNLERAMADGRVKKVRRSA